MNEKIMLWPGDAPYTGASPEQAQPSVTAYPVKDAVGAMVVCPGGAYYGKADHEGGPIACALQENGIAAYVLDYRVNPCDRRAPHADASRAIRVVRAMGYQKVGIIGFSAGGHLALTAATRYDAGDAMNADPVMRVSSRPDAVVPCYPVVSFISHTHQGSVQALLGDQYTDVALRKEYSNELNVTSDTPPAFIWHTANDEAVPVENSLLFARALSDKSVPFEMHIYPNGRHGLGLGTGDPVVSAWMPDCVRWLKGMGFTGK